MTLGEMIDQFKFLVPNAKSSGITDAKIALLLNRGVNETNLRAKVFRDSSEFESVISQQSYSLASNIPDFLGMDEGGVWYENSSGTMDELFPKTKKWFKDNFQNYWEADDGEPDYYFQEGDDLVFEVPFIAARTIKVFHLKKATVMDNNDNYPWDNTTTEVTALMPLDDAIVRYAVWQIQPTLGKAGNEQNAKKAFEDEVRMGSYRVKQRADLAKHRQSGMRVS